MQGESPKTKIRLGDIASEINNRFSEAIRFSSEAQQAGRAAIVAAVETGKLLTKAKKLAGHGNWLKWLADECPNISEDTALNWMKISSNPEVLRNLENFKALKDAYLMVGIMPEPVAVKKALGTGDVDLGESFVSQIAKRCTWIKEQAAGIDLASLPPQRKEELRGIIDQLIEIREALV